MRKTIAWSLILSGCLSGCDVSAVISKPPAERVTKSGLKSSAGKVQKLTPKAEQTEDDAEEPTTQAGTGGTSTTPADTDATEQPTASEAEDTEAEVAETALKLVEAGGTDIGVIPVLEEDGSVTSLLFQNDRSTISWEVEATRGPSALPVSTVKLTLTPTTWYPVPEDPFASEEAVASDAEATTEGEAEETIPPQVIEHPPAEMNWPSSFAAGASQTLTYDIDTPEIRSFLENYYGVSRFSLTITLLDAAGEPLVDDSDAPFTLTQSIQVL